MKGWESVRFGENPWAGVDTAQQFYMEPVLRDEY